MGESLIACLVSHCYESMVQYFNGIMFEGVMTKRLLLLGGTGQLGQPLLRLALLAGWQVWAPERSELDITDSVSITRGVTVFRPNAVINAASFTQVDLAEQETSINWCVNAEAPGWLARSAAAVGAVLLQLSTDYVFDGAKVSPYLESDLPAPLNEYGRAKLAGEEAVKQGCERHLIIRTSWLFGGQGPHFVRSMLALANEHSHISVVSDQVGGPTPVGELADILLQILEQALASDFNSWGIYHCTGTPALSWYQFAMAIFYQLQLHGYMVPVLLPISSQEYAASAVRPLNSCLDNAKMQRVFGLQSPNWFPSMQRFVSDWCGDN